MEKRIADRSQRALHNSDLINSHGQDGDLPRNVSPANINRDNISATVLSESKMDRDRGVTDKLDCSSTIPLEE